MSEPTTTPERTTIHLLFMGRRKGAKAKKVWLWYRIDPDSNDGTKLKYDESRAHYYSGKNIKSTASPGCVVSVQATIDSKTVYPGTAQIVGRWQNRDDVTLWQSQERAEEGMIETEQKTLKELKESLPQEALARFRRAYHKLNSRQQSHMLAWIIQEITRWRPDDDRRTVHDDD